MTPFSAHRQPASFAACFKAMLSVFLLAGLTVQGHAQLERLLAPVESATPAPKPPATQEKAAEVPVTSPAVLTTSQTTKKIEPDPQMFTSEDLLREVKAQMLEHYSINNELVLELARPWGSVKVPISNVALTVVEYPRDGLASLFNIRCKMTSGDQTIGEWVIALRANLWKAVWVASTRLERGQSLDVSMVQSQKVDILQNRNALLDASEKPSAYEMAQNVNTGAALMKRDVIEKPVIRKNQIVEAVINKGALSISTKAQALENGAPHALVRMRNLDSNKEFNAQVVNETQVNVLF